MASTIKKAWVTIASVSTEVELINTKNPDLGKIMVINISSTNVDHTATAIVSIYVKNGTTTEEVWLPDTELSHDNQVSSNDKWFLEQPNRSVMVKSNIVGTKFECTYVTNMP